MIGQFKYIQNVGRFAEVQGNADLVLKRLNLIYSENGRGKTTLCAILRSLSSGDSAPILDGTGFLLQASQKSSSTSTGTTLSSIKALGTRLGRLCSCSTSTSSTQTYTLASASRRGTGKTCTYSLLAKRGLATNGE